MTGTLSEVDGNGKGGGTRGNVNGSSTSEVGATIGERPPIEIPRHTGKWIVDNGRPDEREQKDGPDVATLGESADGDDWTEDKPS